MKLIKVNSFEELQKAEEKVLEEGYSYIDVNGNKMYYWKGANQLIIECLFWK